MLIPLRFLRWMLVGIMLAIFSSRVAQAQGLGNEQDANPGEFGLILGVGGMNCSHWLSSPAIERDGNSWILGWWTATNSANEKNHFVGGDGGGRLIFEKIKQMCTANPSMALTNAVGLIYDEFEESGQ